MPCYSVSLCCVRPTRGCLLALLDLVLLVSAAPLPSLELWLARPDALLGRSRMCGWSDALLGMCLLLGSRFRGGRHHLYVLMCCPVFNVQCYFVSWCSLVSACVEHSHFSLQMYVAWAKLADAMMFFLSYSPPVRPSLPCRRLSSSCSPL
jgi:hypothetical protein